MQQRPSNATTTASLVSALLLTTLLFTHPAQALESVTLQLKWTHAFQFAGYYAAQEKGYYRDAGLNVTLREGAPGIDVVDHVVNGQADFGVGMSSLLLARHAGKPVVALAVIFQHSPQVLLARQQDPAQTIHDLAGKRLMLETQSEELIAYLKREGVALERLNLVKHSFSVLDLINGKTDAISAYSSNEAYFLNQAHVAYQTYTPRAAGIDFYGDNLFTSEQLLHKHPVRTKAFLAASLRGWQYAMAHPEEIAGLIQRKYASTSPLDFFRFEATQSAPLIRADLVEIGYMNPGRWRHIADTYAEIGLLPANFPLDGFLYRPMLKSEDRQMTLYLILSLCLLVLISAVTLYIFRLNRRLQHSVQQSQAAETALRPLSIATEQSPATVVITNLAAEIEYVNPRFTETTGYLPEEVLGKNPRLLNSGLTDKAIYPEMWAKLRQGQAWSGEFINQRKNGTIYWEEAHICPVTNAAGATIKFIALKLDISERKQVEQREAARSEVLELLATGASLETVLTAIVLGVEKDNPAMLGSILLLSPDGKHLHFGAAPSMPDDYLTAMEGLEIGPEVGSSGTATYTGKRVIVEDGLSHPYWRSFRVLAKKIGVRSNWAEPIRSANGKILGVFTIYYRQTHLPTPADTRQIEQAANLAAIAIDRWQAVEALRISEERHRLLADNASDVIWTMDTSGRFTYVSPSVEKLRGFTAAEVMQQSIDSALTPDSAIIANRGLEEAFAAIREGRPFPVFRGELEQPCKDGSTVWTETTTTGMRNEAGTFIGILGVTRDIGERKRAEEHIRHLAQHDPLTDLPNRALLDDRLQQTIKGAQRDDKCFALIFIDLDRFKPVNDHFGHAVGDQLLQAAAQRMLHCIRGSDTLARIGGDEFVVLLPNVGDADGASAVGEKIRLALSQAFEIAGNSLQISSSLGIALYPEHGSTALELARNSDRAMYCAKENGRNKVALYSV